MKGLKSVTFTILAAAMGTFAAADTDLPELEPGVSLHWISSSYGSSDRFRERIIATGDDFQIYETIWDEDADRTPENFFVLFSGIDYFACDGDMPDQSHRDAVRTLKQFEIGASVTTEREDDTVTINVTKAVDFFLMGETYPAYEVEFDYAKPDSSDEVITVLDDAPLTVAINWDDETKDKVLLISSASDKTPPKPTDEQLGKCAALIKE